MFSAYQRHQVGVNSSIPFLPWSSGGEMNTWLCSEPLAPCGQAASLDALPLLKKSEDQKNLGWAHRAGPKLLIWAHFILMASSQRQHLPTGNALVNVSGHWLPKALELYSYICISNFLFLPFTQRKKALVPWVLSKVSVLAVFSFVCFFLNTQVPELARWQKLSELQIIEQTA